jgi:dTDP-glucose 4,6-dehydratase
VVEKILVLGSNSFSGSTTVKVLLDRGYEVIGLNRSPEVPKGYRSYGNRVAGFTFIQLGSNFDPDEVYRLCRDEGITKVINFVAQSMVGQSWENPEDWYETNCVWLARLAKSLSRLDNLDCFLHFTTPEVYGSTKGWQKESFNFYPSTPYAVSRAAGDHHLRIMHSEMGFPVIFTRAANIYGPYQPRYRIVPKAILSALKKEPLMLHGGGQSERSFVYSEDVAGALVNILERGELGESYHISTRSSVTIRELVQDIFKSLEVSFDSLVEITSERPGKDVAYLLDSEKIRQEIGWKESTELSEGIQRTVIWAKEHLEDLLLLPAEYIHRS